MGVFDILGKAGKAAYNGMQEKMEKINEYKEKYDRLDDEQLIKKFKSSSGDVKLACGMLLKERGYGNGGE